MELIKPLLVGVAGAVWHLLLEFSEPSGEIADLHEESSILSSVPPRSWKNPKVTIIESKVINMCFLIRQLRVTIENRPVAQLAQIFSPPNQS